MLDGFPCHGGEGRCQAADVIHLRHCCKNSDRNNPCGWKPDRSRYSSQLKSFCNMPFWRMKSRISLEGQISRFPGLIFCAHRLSQKPRDFGRCKYVEFEILAK